METFRALLAVDAREFSRHRDVQLPELNTEIWRTAPRLNAPWTVDATHMWVMNPARTAALPPPAHRPTEA